MSKLRRAKWQYEYLDRIAKMSNEELLEAYTDLASGDDYDGCYTGPGEWQWGELQKEFKSRLAGFGFFGKRIVITEKSYL